MKLIAALLCLLLSACATVGREVTKDQLGGLEKGKTTAAEVMQRIGPPTTTITSQDGRSTLIYVFAHAQARPESFIPFVGALIGGTDVRSSTVRFVFNKDGTLDDFTHATSSTGAGYGLSAGRYSPPDRSMPQEAAKN